MAILFANPRAEKQEGPRLGLQAPPDRHDQALAIHHQNRGPENGSEKPDLVLEPGLRSRPKTRIQTTKKTTTQHETESSSVTAPEKTRARVGEAWW